MIETYQLSINTSLMYLRGVIGFNAKMTVQNIMGKGYLKNYYFLWYLKF